MCVMSPSAGTGAGGLHVELCVPNENHRAYSEPIISFITGLSQLRSAMQFHIIYTETMANAVYSTVEMCRIKKGCSSGFGLFLRLLFITGYMSVFV
jgi:hypothetical protein